jgi:outer membrane immunogenic protein
MRKILIAAFLLATSAIPAAAADLPLKAPVYKAPAVSPAYNWSGWYVGGHVGYLWGNTSVWDEGVLIESDASTDGVIGGLLAGVNWQSAAFVFGIEGDFGWTNAHGNGAAVQVTERNLYDLNWTSHFRGRIGYATNNWLLFLAGGLALADFDYTQITTVVSSGGGGVYSGWSIGGGVDYAFSPNWVGRIEYLYDDFGDKNYLIGGDPYRVELTGQTLRGAIIFRH